MATGRVVGEDALHVAFICTGNRFRSPLAAALLAAERPALSLRISSFGTMELGAAPALPEAVELAGAFGLDLSAHRTQSLKEADLARYDLVLGFEQHHVAAAVIDAGARSERTFTLRELVSLLEACPAVRLTGGELARARVRIQAAEAARAADFRRTVPEVIDPLGHSPTVQRGIAVELRKSVAALASRLFD